MIAAVEVGWVYGADRNYIEEKEVHFLFNTRHGAVAVNPLKEDPSLNNEQINLKIKFFFHIHHKIKKKSCELTVLNQN